MERSTSRLAGDVHGVGTLLTSAGNAKSGLCAERAKAARRLVLSWVNASHEQADRLPRIENELRDVQSWLHGWVLPLRAMLKSESIVWARLAFAVGSVIVRSSTDGADRGVKDRFVPVAVWPLVY